MRVIVLLAVLLFTVTLTSAQDQDNLYVFDGDLIEATLYHDNGEIAQTGFYTKENKLHGEWVSYDTNGVITAEALYNNGEKIGTWKFYQGNIIKEVTYSNAKIAEVITMEIKDTRVVANK